MGKTHRRRPLADAQRTGVGDIVIYFINNKSQKLGNLANIQDGSYNSGGRLLKHCPSP